MHVLLIDDDESWGFFVSQIISPMNTVRVVSDLPPAIEYLKNHNVDVILLDLSLPSTLLDSGSHGISLLLAFNKLLPIIILTGKLTSSRVINEALLAGAQSWLSKDWIQNSLFEGKSPLLATAIREASIRKMLSNALEEERQQYLNFFSALVNFLSALHSEINLIDKDPRVLDRLIQKIDDLNNR